MATLRTTPRYRVLADQLRKAIYSGDIPLGSQLPPELDLCRDHSVSRHTVREAMRVLREEGLIERRRGSGTVVIAGKGREVFAQKLGAVDDILQYAREARLIVDTVDTVEMPLHRARHWGIAADTPYCRIRGRRVEEQGRVVASSTIYIRADLAPSRELLETFTGAISEWISATHSVATQKIEQKIQAVALDDATAAALGAPLHSPGLRTLRRYIDTGGRTIIVSDTIHPAAGFAYEMTLMRETDG